MLTELRRLTLCGLVVLAVCSGGSTAQPQDAATDDAPSSASPQAATVEVEHALGTSRIPAEPQRVVAVDSLTPAYLAELGLVPVAACTEGDYVPSLLEDLYADIERLPSCPQGIPYEEVAAAGPDLNDQIAGSGDDAYERLSQIAPAVAVAFDDDRVALLDTFGQALGRAEQARDAVGEFDAAADALDPPPVAFSMVALFGEGTYDLFQDNFVLVGLLERLGLEQVPDPTTIDGYDPADNRIRELSEERMTVVRSLRSIMT